MLCVPWACACNKLPKNRAALAIRACLGKLTYNKDGEDCEGNRVKTGLRSDRADSMDCRRFTLFTMLQIGLLPPLLIAQPWQAARVPVASLPLLLIEVATLAVPILPDYEI